MKFTLPPTVERLGIVYTPVEVVDFILQSVNDVLKKNFNRTLSDKKVHVLDPFTGTGTLITRLIQSGLIRQKDLLRKYQNELHANEIVLLAYYIAAINIENTFHDALASFQLSAFSFQKNSSSLQAASCKLTPFFPFDGICFTDTFEMFERDEVEYLDFALEENAERVHEQKETEIKIIIGNPPYSVGQKSANDNAQNNFYPKLEQRISDTYAAGTNATNKNSLYDSYIKAFRWASDRIKDSGVIGFVTNAGWIDGAAMDGMRNCFVNEFSEVYVFNLRGNARTQGELRRREKDNVFGQGSCAPIAITILVKNPQHNGDAQIHYLDIGDYLSRDEKLARIKNLRTVLSDEFKIITPNDKGDWINQRGDEFETYLPLAQDKKFNAAAQSFFVVNSRGLATARDAWAYNFSRNELAKNIQLTIDTYNVNREKYFSYDQKYVFDFDSKKISWSGTLIDKAESNFIMTFYDSKIFLSMYRPFSKSNLYFDDGLNERRGQMPKIFPTGKEKNLLICVPGIGNSKNFSVLITNSVADYQTNFNCQCFPLYWYEVGAQGNLFGGDNYERRDGVTDFILQQARQIYGDAVTKEDIFYYVYGFLHLPSYREKFSAELKKSLPRIFLIEEAQKFWQLVKAGRELAEIHLNYETQEPTADVEVIGGGDYRVKKMRFAKDDKTTLIYNESITIKNIPPRSFEYVVNGRSPLEWIIDRYQVKIDSASGIENNPNDWCLEHDNPRYILDLILSCITVSLKTLDIVDGLPTVDFGIISCHLSGL